MYKVLSYNWSLNRSNCPRQSSCWLPRQGEAILSFLVFLSIFLSFYHFIIQYFFIHLFVNYFLFQLFDNYFFNYFLIQLFVNYFLIKLNLLSNFFSFNLSSTIHSILKEEGASLSRCAMSPMFASSLGLCPMNWPTGVWNVWPQSEPGFEMPVPIHPSLGNPLPPPLFP